MKLRTGFVSNSSSSSFLVFAKVDNLDHNVQAIMDHFYVNTDDGIEGFIDEYVPYGYKLITYF